MCVYTFALNLCFPACLEYDFFFPSSFAVMHCVMYVTTTVTSTNNGYFFVLFCFVCNLSSQIQTYRAKHYTVWSPKTVCTWKKFFLLFWNLINGLVNGLKIVAKLPVYKMLFLQPGVPKLVINTGDTRGK